MRGRIGWTPAIAVWLVVGGFALVFVNQHGTQIPALSVGPGPSASASAAPWSATDCAWASATLRQDAANDINNDPHTSADGTAYLRLVSRWWLTDDAIVQAICRGLSPTAAQCAFAVNSAAWAGAIHAAGTSDWDRTWAANYQRLIALFGMPNAPCRSTRALSYEQDLSACPAPPFAGQADCLARLWSQ